MLARKGKTIVKHSSMDSRCYIPEHLVFDILLLLPVRSLLRFKSVCKSWYTLIDSPIFISHHANRNSGNDSLLGKHYDTENVGYGKFCLLSGNKYEVYNNFNCGLDMDVNPKTDLYDTENVGYNKFCLLSGNKYEVYNNFNCGLDMDVNNEPDLAFSSNGIICFILHDKHITLWNPAMRQWRSLTVAYKKYSFWGFGFNVKSNDHNIVRASLCKKNTSKKRVEVYSLRAGSWRTVHKDFVMPSSFFRTETYQITKDGKCFWIADSYFYNNGNIDGNVILSFDLSEETYEPMPLPVGDPQFVEVIDFLGDKLAYMHYVLHPGRTCHYNIWILHEYGVKESWNKAWKIGLIDESGPRVLYPSRFISNGEFLLFTNKQVCKSSGIFRLYDLGTEENEYLELQQPNLRFLWSVRYTESLFPIEWCIDKMV